MKLMCRRIGCSKFLVLVKNFITAGYMYKGDFIDSDVGIFQGNVTSPILNNIYLHEFDIFMELLSSSFYKGKYRRQSPAYRAIRYEISKLEDTDQIKRARRKLWKIPSKDPRDPNFKRLRYVRYVDDFVVGIVGSREEAADVRNTIRKFLKDELKLNLNEEKSLITHFSKNFISFLGTFIKGDWEKEKKIGVIKKLGVPRKVRLTSRVVLHAPIGDTFEKASQNGFFKKKKGRYIPTKVGRLINLDHADIIKYYNACIRGTLNYYSFANNRKSLGSFVHGLKHSCARTLALKYKLRFASKTYGRFGGKLKCPATGIELFIPNTFKTIKKFVVSCPTPDVILFKK